MNSLFQKLLKTTAPLVNSQLTSGSLKPHFSVVDLQINSSFHTSRERYFRPGLIQLKQGINCSYFEMIACNNLTYLPFRR